MQNNIHDSSLTHYSSQRIPHKNKDEQAPQHQVIIPTTGYVY